MKTCYRIVTDEYAGYEVQIKRWWMPIWFQKWKYGGVNTFRTIEDAQKWIKDGCPVKGDKEQIDVWKGC